MNNSISILLLGFVLAICVSFMVKGSRKPAPEKETQKGTAIGLGGAAVGFISGLLLGAFRPQAIFSDSFLKREGGELGAIALLAIGLSVAGTILFLLIYGLIKKRKA